MNCESLSTIIHGYEIQPLDVWYLRNSLALWVPVSLTVTSHLLQYLLVQYLHCSKGNSDRSTYGDDISLSAK